MSELNLVKPTEYEKLMAGLKAEHNDFEPAFEATVKAVTDIIFAYGHIQKQIFVPGRFLTLQEFSVLTENEVSFLSDRGGMWRYRVEELFRNLIKSSSVLAWNWRNQTLDTGKFVDFFQRELSNRLAFFVLPYERFHASDVVAVMERREESYTGSISYLYSLIPPNFKELLWQILECRKQNETKKEGKDGN